ncbi:MAG: hypothetical protein ACR2IK_19180 [Chloroflexota bacterium]
MLVAQPVPAGSDAPYAAVVARQLSVWPFAARTLRLFVLMDPTLPDPTPHHGLLRAMQQAYFCSDGFSQTRAVREATLAAHYVLRHHNRDVLPLQHVNAATVVAAVRADSACIALAGDAAVFAWRDGVLSGQRGVLRLPRPLGLEQDPHITLWSTRLKPGDRLVLVCGAAWTPNSQARVEDLLRESGPLTDAQVEQGLVAALSGSRPAGVLVVDPAVAGRPERHLALVSTREHGQRPLSVPVARKLEPVARGGRARAAGAWAACLVAVVLLSVTAMAALNLTAGLRPRAGALDEAQTLLAQAEETSDAAQAHALAATALDLASSDPSGGAPALAARATSTLNAIDRVYPVSPAMAVRLGSSGANVIDLTVGDDTLYMLDVVEATVRAFPLDSRDQQPTPDTLLVRAGAQVGPGAQPLAMPVAIQYLSGARADLGVLAVVDQTRAVVQVARDRSITPRPVPSSGSWRELGALGADTEGRLYVLDSGSRRLLEYSSLSQRSVVDPPRLVLDNHMAPGLAFERTAEIVGQQQDVYLRMDDGTLRHFDEQGQEKEFTVRTPDGRPAAVRAITTDRTGGLYLADPANARILQTTADGVVVRQLRDPALAGVRQIRSSLDGRRLYGLVTSGVLVFDVPRDDSP